MTYMDKLKEAIYKDGRWNNCKYAAVSAVHFLLEEKGLIKEPEENKEDTIKEELIAALRNCLLGYCHEGVSGWKENHDHAWKVLELATEGKEKRCQK